MSCTQDFFTSRVNNQDGTTVIGQKDRLWYEPTTNTIRVSNGTPGGLIVGGTGGESSIEIDPIFTASAAAGITLTDISNWDTAYGWDNHATVGYASLTEIQLDGGAANQVLVKQSGTEYDYRWEDLITYEPVYTKLIDDESVALIMYLGEALPNSLEAQAVWRIQEILFDASGNVDAVRYAGSGNFTEVWDNRLALTYA